MAYLITVDGIVQGVGFRPFVYKLAHSMDLKGYVKNSTFGVIIHLECDEKDLNKFLKQLKKDAPKEFIIIHKKRSLKNFIDITFYHN